MPPRLHPGRGLGETGIDSLPGQGMKERPAFALIELLLAASWLASAGAQPASDFLNVRDFDASGSTFQTTGSAQAGFAHGPLPIRRLSSGRICFFRAVTIEFKEGWK